MKVTEEEALKKKCPMKMRISEHYNENCIGKKCMVFNEIKIQKHSNEYVYRYQCGFCFKE